MAKRPHGTGHVYVKWGSFYGRWRAPDGRLLNRRIGKVRERGMSDGLTRRQAEQALRELVATETANPRRASDEPGKTVDDALDPLRGRLALEGARRSYQQNCESMQRVHISPRFGARRLETVDRRPSSSLPSACFGLAPKTVLNVLKFHGPAATRIRAYQSDRASRTPPGPPPPQPTPEHPPRRRVARRCP